MRDSFDQLLSPDLQRHFLERNRGTEMVEALRWYERRIRIAATSQSMEESANVINNLLKDAGKRARRALSDV